MSSEKHFKIAIQALGGQGGGVLAGWIVELGQRCGFIAQSTSVPGVAQRTGATVYYIELFPKSRADAEGADPVLALMPVPGDVDIVLASEVMEAGRALERGFITANTTVISSSHRVYAIGEKIAMGDGRQDPSAIIDAVSAAAGRFLLADMEACAEDTGAIISSVLFGALAGSGALPVQRDEFESVIRDLRRAVDTNLAGFAAGYNAVAVEPTAAEDRDDKADPGQVGSSAPPRSDQLRQTSAAPAVQPLLDKLSKAIAPPAQDMALHGLKKVVDHSGPRYGKLYLNRLTALAALESPDDPAFTLTNSVARYLALAMAFEDTIRVADLKTRTSRFQRFRNDVVAEPDQIVHVAEYMHPRVEELCDLLPPWLARWVLKTRSVRRVLGVLLGKGRRVPTTSLLGFLPLYALSGLRVWRPFTYKYQQENRRIEQWLVAIAQAADKDAALAVEIAGLQRLIKGYGETHERGLGNYQRIMALLNQVRDSENPAATLRGLRDAALKDEEGAALATEIQQLSMSSEPSPA